MWADVASGNFHHFHRPLTVPLHSPEGRVRAGVRAAMQVFFMPFFFRQMQVFYAGFFLGIAIAIGHISRKYLCVQTQ